MPISKARAAVWIDVPPLLLSVVYSLPLASLDGSFGRSSADQCRVAPDLLCDFERPPLSGGGLKPALPL